MPDDIPIAPLGTPYPVVTDELAGGRHVQVMKTGFGGDGLLTPVDATNPLPVVSALSLGASRFNRAWVNANQAGFTPMITGTPGMVIRLFRIWFVSFGDVSFQLCDGESAFHPPIPLLGYGSFVLDFDSEPWFETSPGNALEMYMNVAGQLSGQFYFIKS